MSFSNNADIRSRISPTNKEMLEKMAQSMATSPVAAALSAAAFTAVPAAAPHSSDSTAAPASAAQINGSAGATTSSSPSTAPVRPLVGADGQVSMKIEIPELIEVCARQLAALNELGEQMNALVTANKKLVELSDWTSKSQNAVQQNMFELLSTIKGLSNSLPGALNENTRAIHVMSEKFDKLQAAATDSPQEVAAKPARTEKTKPASGEKSPSSRKPPTAAAAAAAPLAPPQDEEDDDNNFFSGTFMNKRSLDNSATARSNVIETCTELKKQTVFGLVFTQMPHQYMLKGVDQLALISATTKISFGFPDVLAAEVKTGSTRVTAPKIVVDKSDYTWFKKPLDGAYLTEAQATDLDKASGKFPTVPGDGAWGYWLPYVGVVASFDRHTKRNRLVPVAIVKEVATGNLVIRNLGTQAIRNLFNSMETDDVAIARAVNAAIAEVYKNDPKAEASAVAAAVYVKVMAFQLFTAADGTTMPIPVIPDWMLYQRIISVVSGVGDVKGSRSKAPRPAPAFDNGEDTSAAAAAAKPRRNSVSGDSAASKSVKESLARASAVNNKRVDDEDDEVADISSRKRPSSSSTSNQKNRRIEVVKSDDEEEDSDDESSSSSSSSDEAHKRSSNKSQEPDSDDDSEASHAESVEIIAHGETPASQPFDDCEFDDAPEPAQETKSNYITISDGKGGKLYAYLSKNNPRLKALIAVKGMNLEFATLQTSSAREFWDLAASDPDAFGTKGAEWLIYTREHKKQPNYPLSAFAGIHTTSFQVYVLFSFWTSPPAAEDCYPMNTQFTKAATKLFFDNFISNKLESTGYPRVVLPVTDHNAAIPKCTVIPTTLALFNKIRDTVLSMPAYKNMLMDTQPDKGMGSRMVEFIHRVLD